MGAPHAERKNFGHSRSHGGAAAAAMVAAADFVVVSAAAGKNSGHFESFGHDAEKKNTKNGKETTQNTY